MEKKYFRSLMTLSFLVIFWWFVAFIDVLPDFLLPGPIGTFIQFVSLLKSGAIFRSSLLSLIRVFSGFAIASLAGVGLGLLIGWFDAFKHYSNVIVELIRPIPPIAWIPLALAWFGVGIVYNSFVIFLGAFFPILLNTISGVRGIEGTRINAAKTLGADNRDILRDIVIPGAMPSIFTGLRTGWGIGWMTVVAAEMIGANSGLGFLIFQAYKVAFDLKTVLVGMAVIGGIGLVTNQIFRLIEDRALNWRPSNGKR
ncbi:MAG: ABC-type nitrate/sulfonate/bicarbonate transport system permease component [Candidatus Methanohalarchaeum thermophilum]|uniref:ABC-type nitrate/sulfonate/bicarbonate transport system permease component n=1 Tax=Methanohalarchaeum thermophilum TaxID=1903181 RepID=A0A1Q6DU51_METT1|nr:MAG: ABC-type nitrate/sulfonate/bicarbonate transport system permease component [Candidatus Methanohalarchaeum thermophilum]